MGENESALELKKEALKEELEKPKEVQNRDKIFRLKDSIKRHKMIGKFIKSIRDDNWKKRKMRKK